MDAFSRLSAALQYQIANGLGWSELRPVQEESILAVLEGANCIVLAPTAGGKTEAALFPLLSLMDEEEWPPVSVLYIAPIRALLNNQEARLQTLTALVGRRAFKWHGDVNQSKRRRFIEDPADVLAITPESLEAMLLSFAVPKRRLLANIRAVVIDEVHAFAGDDRGAHLVAMLERVQRLCRKDFLRIGLSATVGNPEEIGRWLAGSSHHSRRVIHPHKSKTEAEIVLDYVGNEENAALLIERLFPGSKRLVFVDSRSRVEALGDLLGQRGVAVYVTHSSLAVAERNAAERAFEEGDNCVIVATSALELGIDVGDLDHVIQVDCPSTVSAFLQRMGRTGRRPESVANCTFLVTKDQQLLQAAALLRLYKEGYVEPVLPSYKASHLLAHQLLSLTLQEQGVPAGEWWDWLEGASIFARLTKEDRQELLHHMLGQQILVEADRRLLLGQRGEELYSKRNFMDLYAVFSTPPVFRVLWGPREIGQIDLFFILQRDEKDLSFFLGGKAWRLQHVDWRRAICYVEPSSVGGYPSWYGRPLFLSKELCHKMREVLLDDLDDPWWSKRTCQTMKSLRIEHHFLHDEPAPFLHETDKIRWWTFAGGKANNLLARLLEKELGGKVSANNLVLTFAQEAARSEVAIRHTLERFMDPQGLSEHTVRILASSLARGRISKFQPCLSERLELEFLADRLADLEGAREAITAALEGRRNVSVQGGDQREGREKEGGGPSIELRWLL